MGDSESPRDESKVPGAAEVCECSPVAEADDEEMSTSLSGSPRRSPSKRVMSVRTKSHFRLVLDGVELPCEDAKVEDDPETAPLCGERYGVTQYLMLMPSGAPRIVWDLGTLVAVVFIAVVLPYRLAFKVEAARGSGWWHVENALDALFMVDVVLNFRTGYYDADGALVMGARPVAVNYLKSWFLLDFVSSAPLDLLFGPSFANLNAAKLLKVGKLMKVMKLLRLSKFQSRTGNIQDFIEEALVSRSVLVFLTAARMALNCLFLCHLLACFMVLSGPGYLRGYPKDAATRYDRAAHWGIEKKYVAAMYFAMTTMTTVGYGDITPDSDGERVFAMLAMCIGGGFYGYVIGVIASLVAMSDANEAAYLERMKHLRSWLAHHEFPRDLHRRVRRYYKEHFEERSALDEQRILRDLNDELREEVVDFLLPPAFADNYLFASQNAAVILKFADSIRPLAATANEVVIRAGEPGDVMFVVATGAAVASRDFDVVDATAAAAAASGPSGGPGEMPEADSLRSGATGDGRPSRGTSARKRRSMTNKASASFDATAGLSTPLTKRPTRPIGGRASIALDRADSFGELVALAVHNVYCATLETRAATGFYCTSQIQIYRNLGELHGVLYDMRHHAVSKAVRDGFLAEAELANFKRANAHHDHANSDHLSPETGATLLAAVRSLAAQVADVKADLAAANAKLARIETRQSSDAPAPQ